MLKLQGDKPKFAQITGSEIFHKSLKSKNLQKKYFTGEKPEITYITWGKPLLTLIFLKIIYGNNNYFFSRHAE